jgi:hypothetical protein
MGVAYSQDLRERVANELPVKMVVPLALGIFPVILMSRPGLMEKEVSRGRREIVTSLRIGVSAHGVRSPALDVENIDGRGAGRGSRAPGLRA